MRRLPIFVALAVLPLFLLACGELVNNGTAGAQIVSLTLEPNTISLSDTGMTDEYFTVTLVTGGFVDPVDPETAVVFIQEPERTEAEPGTREVSGNTITLGMIAKSWFAGLEPGVYNIGAEVSSETEQVRQLDLATVTVEE